MHDAFAAFGRIDLIVNSDGSGPFGTLEDTKPDETHHLFEVDVLAPISIIRTALPFAQGSGYIINFTSFAGQAPGTGLSVSASAKAALERLSAALANEVRPLGVRATAVAPGQFWRDFMPDTCIHKVADSNSTYSSTVGARLMGLADTYNIPLGDPLRAARVICKVAGAPNPPLHLLPGSDAFARAEKKVAEMTSEMNRWRTKREGTDFSDSGKQY